MKADTLPLPAAPPRICSCRLHVPPWASPPPPLTAFQTNGSTRSRRVPKCLLVQAAGFLRETEEGGDCLRLAPLRLSEKRPQQIPLVLTPALPAHKARKPSTPVLSPHRLLGLQTALHLGLQTMLCRGTPPGEAAVECRRLGRRKFKDFCSLLPSRVKLEQSRYLIPYCLSASSQQESRAAEGEEKVTFLKPSNERLEPGMGGLRFIEFWPFFCLCVSIHVYQSA
ncbi:hypothetical protein TGRH88_002340 [Toxoplasma gondii]|uniref:Uncharacterized protein n=1 Tax=Toxoplasma gondii TaxID=5811 RepID=A0A7J6KF44_TOXGO|nr:hypothetical protein TGRH88_002340 [Toxoplasma gondii]